MTMTLDSAHQQRFGPQMNFDYSAASQPPTFSNPWSTSSSQAPSAGGSALMMSSHQQPTSQQQSHHSHHSQPSALSANMLAAKAQAQPTRPPTTTASSSMTPYGSLPVGPTSNGKHGHFYLHVALASLLTFDCLVLSQTYLV
jgi:hypothetical protein